MLANLTPADIAILVVSLLFSTTIHEFMHAYAGHLLGDHTAKNEGRLSLNPLRHLDPFMSIILPLVTLVLPPHYPFMAAKPVPFNPNFVRFREYGAAILAAAGPLSNLVLAVIASILAGFFAFSPGVDNALGLFIIINVILFVFNLIPLPPLDGSRVLYAFAPEPVQEFMQTIEPYGFFIIIALIFLFPNGGLFSFLSVIYNFVLNLLSHL